MKEAIEFNLTANFNEELDNFIHNYYFSFYHCYFFCYYCCVDYFLLISKSGISYIRCTSALLIAINQICMYVQSLAHSR